VEHAGNPDRDYAKSCALYGGQGAKAMTDFNDMDIISEVMIEYQDDCLEQPEK